MDIKITMDSSIESVRITRNAAGEVELHIRDAAQNETRAVAAPRSAGYSSNRESASGYKAPRRRVVQYIDSGEIPVISKGAQQLLTKQGEEEFRKLDHSVVREVQAKGRVLVRKNFRLSNQGKVIDDLAELGLGSVTERTFKVPAGESAHIFGDVYAVAK